MLNNGLCVWVPKLWNTWNTQVYVHVPQTHRLKVSKSHVFIYYDIAVAQLCDHFLTIPVYFIKLFHPRATNWSKATQIEIKNDIFPHQTSEHIFLYLWSIFPIRAGTVSIYFVLLCLWIFTRCQFWPSGIVTACVCVCVSVCVSVCASITCLSAR